jgi:hypothetical protein
MICDGCQQAFCGKHSIEHRQELTNQLDGIMQEHDLLQQELRQPSIDNSLLKQINKWEKESITRIQIAAETARADLRQVLDGPRESISKTCHDIAVNLRSAREADDFSESDLNRWMEQLKELKLEFDSPSSIKLVEDADSPISLIRIKHKDLTNKKPTNSKQISLAKTPALPVVQERFLQVFGRAIIEEEGAAIRHVGVRREYVYVLGEQLYSQDRQVVRFRIGYENAQYKTFFGCISSVAINNKIDFDLSTSAGWFGRNEIYHHGVINYKDYDSSEIRTDDVLSVIFDCENQQIELYHERTNKTNKIPIDIGKAPLPWRLLVVLYRPNDWIRIISND